LRLGDCEEAVALAVFGRLEPRDVHQREGEFAVERWFGHAMELN
jgi:hypothetical protein